MTYHKTISAAYFDDNPDNKQFDRYTCDNLMQLSFQANDPIYTSLRSIQNRISLYKDIIQNALSKFTDIFDGDTKIYMNLAARPIGIYVNDGSFGTETTNQNSPAAYDRLTSFFKESIDQNMTIKDDSNVIYDLSNFNQLFNSLSNFNTDMYSYELSSNAGQVAKCTNILIELNSLMIELQKIKQFNVNYVFYKTNIETEFVAKGQRPTTKGCQIFASGFGANTVAQVFLSPYKAIVQPSEKPMYTMIQSSQMYDQLCSIVDFNNLVKLDDSCPEHIQTFPLDAEGSNGILATTVKVETEDFNLIESVDLKQTFGLQSGKPISRKSILKAIDTIFMTWLKNMKCMTYVTTICHTNCHSNNILNYTVNARLNKITEVYEAKCVQTINLYNIKQKIENGKAVYSTKKEYDISISSLKVGSGSIVDDNVIYSNTTNTQYQLPIVKARLVSATGAFNKIDISYDSNKTISLYKTFGHFFHDNIMFDNKPAENKNISVSIDADENAEYTAIVEVVAIWNYKKNTAIKNKQ